jgi:hypothetical protein
VAIYRSIPGSDPLLAKGVTTAGRAKFTVSLPKGARLVYGELRVPSLDSADTKTIKVSVK